jgi:hypothetical protein
LEDRKIDQKLSAERKVGAIKIADEMFEAAVKSAKEGKGDQVVPQDHPASAWAHQIHQREQRFENLKATNSRVNHLAIKVKKTEEELKRMKDEKEETRKRRADPQSAQQSC